MKESARGFLALLVMVLVLAVVVLACIAGYSFYSQGFNETTKNYVIAFFCVGFVWWLVASLYRTLRK